MSLKKTDAETQVLFEFIAHRYESGSLVITSNQPFSQWDQIFKDPMTTMAAIDRLVHHAVILEFNGESVRSQKAQGREKDPTPPPGAPSGSTPSSAPGGAKDSVPPEGAP